VIAIQRAINKILIAVVLSREFKHDETNRAWWTGRWYGRGLGTHVFSQPAREFVVKIIELSLWTSDVLIGHILLFMLTIPLMIPYIDRIHATMLCMFALFVTPCRPLMEPIFSLAAAVETNSCTPVHFQTEEATPLDSKSPFSIRRMLLTILKDNKIRHNLYCGNRHFRDADRYS
jgi:hypothetical protein